MITPWMAICLVALALVVMLAILKIEQRDAVGITRKR